MSEVTLELLVGILFDKLGIKREKIVEAVKLNQIKYEISYKPVDTELLVMIMEILDLEEIDMVEDPELVEKKQETIEDMDICLVDQECELNTLENTPCKFLVDGVACSKDEVTDDPEPITTESDNSE